MWWSSKGLSRPKSQGGEPSLRRLPEHANDSLAWLSLINLTLKSKWLAAFPGARLVPILTVARWCCSPHWEFCLLLGFLSPCKMWTSLPQPKHQPNALPQSKGSRCEQSHQLDKPSQEVSLAVPKQTPLHPSPCSMQTNQGGRHSVTMSVGPRDFSPRDSDQLTHPHMGKQLPFRTPLFFHLFAPQSQYQLSRLVTVQFECSVAYLNQTWRESRSISS